MTACMIRYDEQYSSQVEEFIDRSDGKIELIKDPNLKIDPYFYERKEQLQEILKAVDNGTMKMYDQEEWDIQMQKLDEELDNL